MENFNAICSELKQKLALTGEVDGVIYWYEGVPQLLFEMMRFLLPRDTETEITESDNGDQQ